MKFSETLDKIAPALCKAQAEMAGAKKDSTNPFFNAAYADLTSVWRACKEALHSNGLSVIQSPINQEGRIGVTTMLLHSSGQYIMDEYTLGVKKQNDPQADGSSLTYSRRYALAAFVGICTEDDDGEKSMNRNHPPKSYTTQQNHPNQPMQNQQKPKELTLPQKLQWMKDNKLDILKEAYVRTGNDALATMDDPKIVTGKINQESVLAECKKIIAEIKAEEKSGPPEYS